MISNKCLGKLSFVVILVGVALTNVGDAVVVIVVIVVGLSQTLDDGLRSARAARGRRTS